MSTASPRRVARSQSSGSDPLAKLDSEMATLSMQDPVAPSISEHPHVRMFSTPISAPVPLAQTSSLSSTSSRTRRSVSETFEYELEHMSRAGPRTRSLGGAVNQAATSGAAQPLYSYRNYKPTPVIVYTQSEDEADELIQTLKGPLGFDMEWRVDWGPPRKTYPTALIQFSDERTILLVQISAMKSFPQKVKEVIESPEIIKMGANIQNDGTKLREDYGVVARSLLELGAFARHHDPAFRWKTNRDIVSLAKVVETYTGCTLAKGKVRISNWELDLNAEQKEYAANDAHCALMVYKKVIEVAKAADPTCTIDPFALITAGSRNPPNQPQVPAHPAANTTPTGSVSRPPLRALEAYALWHWDNMSRAEICVRMRSATEPLKDATVINYIVASLQDNPALPFSMRKLKELVDMDGPYFNKHSIATWLSGIEAQGR